MNKPEREGFVKDDPVETDKEVITPDEEKEIETIAESVPEWPMVIKLLHKPIQKSRTVTLTEITFREPTTMDIIKCGGNPCRIEVTEISGGRVVYNPIIDDAKMMVLIANLSGLVEPQIQKMDPRDYTSCAYRLRAFFLPEQGVW
jgi:Phage tail assembly chaperone proteins, E, or 41 or 14